MSLKHKTGEEGSPKVAFKKSASSTGAPVLTVAVLGAFGAVARHAQTLNTDFTFAHPIE